MKARQKRSAAGGHISDSAQAQATSMGSKAATDNLATTAAPVNYPCPDCGGAACFWCDWSGQSPSPSGLVLQACDDLEAIFIDWAARLERVCDLATADFGPERAEGYFTRAVDARTKVIMHYEFGGGFDPVAYVDVRDGEATMTGKQADAHAPLVGELDRAEHGFDLEIVEVGR